MKAWIAIAASLALGGSAFGQWSDDFNRPDGPIGGDWTVVTGTWMVVSNQGAHTSSSANEIVSHNLATGTYDSAVVHLDVFAPGSSSQFSGVLIGLGGTDTIQVKIQDQVSGTPGFSNIGIYHRTSATGWGAWTGTGTGFASLTAPFLMGRLKVYFSDPDTLVAEIDTDFDGNPDQSYSKTGVLALAPNLGTGFGLIGWGTTARFDNWSADVAGAGPVSYCTPGTTSNGCLATITADNNPSVTAANPCNLTVSNAEGQKSGIIFYGLMSNSANWCATGGSSFLCVKSPSQRTGAQNTGGTSGACDGSMTLDWNAYQAANPTALGNPWSAGQHAYAQGWFRDPASCKTTSMSDGVDMTYVP
jgi:hypothetical protein